MAGQDYSKDLGVYLVVMPLDGYARWLVGEVTNTYPLTVKVTENGPYAKLASGEFIVHEYATAGFQASESQRARIINDFASDGCPLLSGLESLGLGGKELNQVIFA